ncbi:MAG TPA: hypothetical protein VK157_05715 [Phycisphaerales bacterium]|nr:hypothetical protein [Phycisphaerales bacterium]
MMRSHPTRLLALAVAFAACASLVGCVTVVEDSRGVPLPRRAETGKKSNNLPKKPAGKTSAVSPREPEQTVPPELLPPLPDGQIAKRVEASSLTSRVQVAVVPLGVVEYDGQTLPLVSPDGRFIAVQQGKPPAWETVLAEDGAPLARQTRIAIYQFTANGIEQVEPVDAFPDGLLLGRDATNQHFLVEQQRPDGSRWIATIAWATGAARWIAQGTDVNSHAVFVQSPDGDSIAYTRRRQGLDERGLVLRARDGTEATLAPSVGTFAFPMPSSSHDVIFAAQASFDGISIVSVAAITQSGVKLTGPLATRKLTDAKDLFTAYQMFAPLQPSVSLITLPDSDDPAGLFIHPTRGRVGVYNPKANTITNLPSQTIAATRYEDASNRGYFATSPQGLIFVPDGGLGSDDQFARVFAGPYVPRVITWDGQPTLLLFGPDKRSTTRLELLRMRVQ